MSQSGLIIPGHMWHLVCLYIVWRDYWFLFGFGCVYVMSDGWSWRRMQIERERWVPPYDERVGEAGSLEWAIGEDTRLGYMC